MLAATQRVAGDPSCHFTHLCRGSRSTFPELGLLELVFSDLMLQVASKGHGSARDGIWIPNNDGVANLHSLLLKFIPAKDITDKLTGRGVKCSGATILVHVSTEFVGKCEIQLIGHENAL